MLYLIKTITKIVVIFFAAVVFTSSANNAFSAENDAVRDGIITAFRLNVRLGPSNETRVYYVLKKGAEIKIHGDMGEDGSWIQIGLNGKKGYVRNRTKYVRLIKTVKPKTDSDKTSIKTTIIKDTETEKTTPTAALTVLDDKKSITKQIKQKQEKIISFSKEEIIIIEGLDEIDSTLSIARVRVSNISDNLNKLGSKIKYIVEEKEKISQEYDQKRIYSGTRLNALYRMRMLGKFEIISEPDSIFDFIIQQKALGKIIDSDLNILDEQRRTMQRYEKLGNELKQKEQEKFELERELNQQILITEKKSKRKKEILKKIRTEKRLALAAVQSLKKAAQKLDKQIEQIKKSEFIKKNSRSFLDFQGRLTMPVKGRIISKFGTDQSSDNKTFTFQKGIDIKPGENDSVRAVFYGKVIFARWFQGYGNLLIIDHGDNYYSLYAHNKELLKRMDEMVEKGEVVAIVGDTGSIKGLCLHFEIRHHGKPVDPMKWLKKGA